MHVHRPGVLTPISLPLLRSCVVEKLGSEVVFKGDLLISRSKIKISDKVPIPQEDKLTLTRMPITAGGR
jgi:hypothetical protein